MSNFRSYKKPYKKGKRYNVRKAGMSLTPAQKSEVKKIIAVRQEHKYYQSGITYFPLPIIPTIALNMFTPTQGDADSQRSGDRVMFEHIQLKYTLAWEKSNPNTLTGAVARVVVFQWHPDNTPVPSSVLLTDPISGNVTVDSFYSIDNRQMYKILYDKCTNVNGVSNVGTFVSATSNSVTFHKKIIPSSRYNKQVQFQGGTTGSTNNIYVFGLATAAVDFDFNLFFRYTDS